MLAWAEEPLDRNTLLSPKGAGEDIRDETPTVPLPAKAEFKASPILTGSELVSWPNVPADTINVLPEAVGSSTHPNSAEHPAKYQIRIVIPPNP
jgi:hypothetical protein